MIVFGLANFANTPNQQICIEVGKPIGQGNGGHAYGINANGVFAFNTLKMHMFIGMMVFCAVPRAKRIFGKSGVVQYFMYNAFV